jgi:hypothetical protein
MLKTTTYCYCLPKTGNPTGIQSTLPLLYMQPYLKEKIIGSITISA